MSVIQNWHNSLLLILQPTTTIQHYIRTSEVHPHLHTLDECRYIFFISILSPDMWWLDNSRLSSASNWSLVTAPVLETICEPCSPGGGQTPSCPSCHPPPPAGWPLLRFTGGLRRHSAITAVWPGGKKTERWDKVRVWVVFMQIKSNKRNISSNWRDRDISPSC